MNKNCRSKDDSIFKKIPSKEKQMLIFLKVRANQQGIFILMGALKAQTSYFRSIILKSTWTEAENTVFLQNKCSGANKEKKEAKKIEQEGEEDLPLSRQRITQ